MANRKRQSLKPTLNNFAEAISTVLQDITEEVYEAVDRGLDKGAKLLQKKLEEATPVDSGETKGGWQADLRYTNVRYINNERLNDKGIPVVNLLEFGSKGKPFVRKTVAENQDEIINIIKGELQNGNT